VDPGPGPLILRKSGSVENRTRTSGSVARNSDRENTLIVFVDGALRRISEQERGEGRVM
jgi:hypothetical protein